VVGVPQAGAVRPSAGVEVAHSSTSSIVRGMVCVVTRHKHRLETAHTTHATAHDGKNRLTLGVNDLTLKKSRSALVSAAKSEPMIVAVRIATPTRERPSVKRFRFRFCFRF